MHDERPIFETDFGPGTTAITVPDAEVELLGEHEDKVIVSCEHAVGVAQGWRRRGDLEELRAAGVDADAARQQADAEAAAAYEGMSPEDRDALDKAKADARAADAAVEDARQKAEAARAKADAKAKKK